MANETIYDSMGNPTGMTADPVSGVSSAPDMRDAFARALNVTVWEKIKSLGNEQTIIGYRTPDQIIDAFASVKPEWQEALNIMKGDDALKKALHDSLKNDPSMLEGLSRMAGQGTGFNGAEFARALNDPITKMGITAALTRIAANPNDDVNFDDFKTLYDNRNDSFAALKTLKDMGVNPVDIIKAHTPEQFMNSLIAGKPDWAAPLTAIKAHPELRDALYGAITKDPSMLDGLASMAATGAGANPQEFLAAVNDPLSRRALTLALNKIAEKPDDDLDFADFKELYDNRNNKVRALTKLNQMGIKTTDLMGGIGGDEIFSMLREALMSPTGFRDLMNKLPEMLGLSGQQAAAARDAFGMIGNYLDLCMGTKQDGFRALANQYGDTAVANTKDFFERISGQRDEEIARQRREAGQGTPVDPATSRTAGVRSGDLTTTANNAGQITYTIPPEQAAALSRYDQQTAALTEARREPAPTP